MLWLYMNIKKHRAEENKKFENAVKMLCTFINPEAAKKVFSDSITMDSDGFEKDMKSIDPNFDYAAFVKAFGD